MFQKIIFIIACLFPFLLSAQQVQDVLPLNPEVTFGKLANGFTYYIQKNTSPQKKADLYLVNKVGSILEEENQLGLAHFMEHMNFKGTKNFPRYKLVDYLEKQGVKFGADLNAYTSLNETVYQLPISTSDSEVFANAMQIMRDWAQDALLESSEMDKERWVILEEKRAIAGVRNRVNNEVFNILTNHSRYSKRLPIGTEEIISGFEPEVLRKFHRDWYRPNLQALIVVGDINVEQVENQIKLLFSDLKNPDKAPKRIEYPIVLNGKNQFFTFTDPELEQTQMQVTMKFKESPIRTGADYRKAIVKRILENLLLNRYNEAAQGTGISFLQGSAEITTFIASISGFSVTVIPHPGKLENAFQEVWRELDRVKRFGFTEVEFNRSKKRILMGVENAYKERDKNNSINLVKEYSSHFLNGMAVPGITLEYQMLQEFLPSITQTEVKNALNDLISNKNRDIIVTAPSSEKANLPQESDVLSWMRNAESSPLPPYQDILESTGLLDQLPSPGWIQSEKKVEDLGLTELTLNNGLRVLIKQSDFKNDEILFTGFSRGGSSLYDNQAVRQAENAVNFIKAMGLGKHSPTALNTLLSGKSVQVNVAITNNFETLSGITRQVDLESALQLAHLYFTDPRKEKSLFDNLLAQSRPTIESRYNNPNTVFSDTINRVLSNYNPRFSVPDLKLLNELDVDRILAIYKERFANAADFTFIFVGNFDEPNLKVLIEKYLGSLPSNGMLENFVDRGIRPAKGRINKTIFEGTEDKASVLMAYTGSFDYNRLDAIAMSALAEVLQMRITARLRFIESGVYSPNVKATLSKYPSQFNLKIVFGSASNRTEELIKAAEEEVERLKILGPTAEELHKFVVSQKLAREQSMKQNMFWIQALASKLQNEEPLVDIIGFEKLLDQLTIDKVKGIANQYINNDLMIFKMLPKAHQIQ
ncbi:M16 family metallopeptidase [Sphingobacterium sp. HJSM2_6]|uniref:M16 family metallopeptidase n=1 Tax=Sphingobacterium sp. HJSM2_6 TaxID=3366264 RepID=UPI003BE0D3B3